MTVLRTPDTQFENLPDYSFTQHYTVINDSALGDMRLHYVDEGPRNGRIVIMMHGEPSWSYLYRKMITQVANAGCRVLAPDLIGFGRSDKPSAQSDYSYSGHVDWMSQWLEAVDTRDAVLFCQDWGGLIGLRLVAKYPERFAGVIAANTFLPTGQGSMPDAFMQWREFAKVIPEFPVGGVIRGATVNDLGPGEEAAYNAPYPDESYKAGARIFPALVPISPDMDGVDDNLNAWDVLSRFDKPFLTAFSDQDPITAGLDKHFHSRVPGCKGQPHQIVKGGGHFLQEDVPDALSQIILEFCERL
ncbi:haloalkane dehalogenase [Fretibacter rubidus]|uniref:haloalkane dehalogenase n=1 Tax=Fretibacter rubidus TaxID=570162 RepID=UPI00352A8CCF